MWLDVFERRMPSVVHLCWAQCAFWFKGEPNEDLNKKKFFVFCVLCNISQEKLKSKAMFSKTILFLKSLVVFPFIILVLVSSGVYLSYIMVPIHPSHLILNFKRKNDAFCGRDSVNEMFLAHLNADVIPFLVFSVHSFLLRVFCNIFLGLASGSSTWTTFSKILSIQFTSCLWCPSQPIWSRFPFSLLFGFTSWF